MSFIKWVGGKQQIMSEIMEFFPAHINTYYELFIGGGSVLLELLNKCERGEMQVNQFIVNDINTELVHLYRNIKDRVELLIEHLVELDGQFKRLSHDALPFTSPTRNRQEFYYYIRNEYNKLKLDEREQDNILKSVYLIFLNKVGFRGLYRENKNKEYNVSYGNYKNPTIANPDVLRRTSMLFNKYNTTFMNVDFVDVLPEQLHEDDFVYLDPPYYPIDENSFVYNNFTDKDHEKVIQLINTIDAVPVKFLMSNSYVFWIIERIKNFNSRKIICKRQIHSKKPQSKTDEILVWN